jgi:transposase
LTSLLTSYAVEVGLGVIEVLGVERRRRWPDAVKLSILAEVNTGGWSLADVARRHDVTRQHIYQWRRELRAKGLLPGNDAPTFLPVELAPSTDTASRGAASASASDIAIVLRGGRQLRCRETIAEMTLVRLIRALEAA